ncbi:MAG TPA: hypothetical protein VG322_04930 [Candidatus Acidoferrales bacterium]|nr:hypothetical protein [Candidatus Acidoferrales bacterium]
MPDALCKHQRKRLIAKDDDSQYWECLDCSEILEAAELMPEPVPEPVDERVNEHVNERVNDRPTEPPSAQPAESLSASQKPPGFDESLSDA